jgi:hypothetical protein
MNCLLLAEEELSVAAEASVAAATQVHMRHAAECELKSRSAESRQSAAGGGAQDNQGVYQNLRSPRTKRVALEAW